jgi:hypothetical protein
MCHRALCKLLSSGAVPLETDLASVVGPEDYDLYTLAIHHDTSDRSRRGGGAGGGDGARGCVQDQANCGNTLKTRCPASRDHSCGCGGYLRTLLSLRPNMKPPFLLYPASRSSSYHLKRKETCDINVIRRYKRVIRRLSVVNISNATR